MSRRRLTTIAAGLVAAAITTAAPAAKAADLSGDYEPRYGSPYDDPDPRYADMYRHPAPYAGRGYKDGRYDDDYDPPARTYYRDDREYLPPMRHPPRFADRDGCVPRHVVKSRLRAEGWSSFHDLELSGGTAFVRARRPSGRLFELRIDRCSGEVVNARPYGPHAYGPRSYRYRS
jgi:hypothetical protein